MKMCVCVHWITSSILNRSRALNGRSQCATYGPQCFYPSPSVVGGALAWKKHNGGGKANRFGGTTSLSVSITRGGCKTAVASFTLLHFSVHEALTSLMEERIFLFSFCSLKCSVILCKLHQEPVSWTSYYLLIHIGSVVVQVSFWYFNRERHRNIWTK